MWALGQANDIRTNRRVLKESIRAERGGESAFRALAILDQPPRAAATMKVADLLQTIRGVGHVKRDKILRTVRISPSKTLTGLTPRQRRELAEQLIAQHGPARKERR